MTVEGRHHAVEVDGRWCVVWWRADQPDWLRVLAWFRSKDRAERYAEVENDCFDDQDFVDDPDLSAVPPAAPEPESAVQPENFRKPEPKALPKPRETLVDPQEDAEACEPEVPEYVEERVDADDADAAEPEPADDDDEPAALDGDPAALTGRALQLWEHITGIANAGGALPVSASKLADEAGVPKGSHGYAWEQLEFAKPVLERFGLPDGRWALRLVDGRVLEQTAEPDEGAKKERGDRYTDIWPKKRRCVACESIFDSHGAADQHCTNCMSARAPA